MTEEEAARLDEYYTNNPIETDPARPGIFSRMKQESTPIFVDEFTARYLTAKAIATKRTPTEVISDMVRSEIASGQKGYESI